MAEETWDYLGEKWEDIAQPVSNSLFGYKKKTCKKYFHEVQGTRCNDTHLVSCLFHIKFSSIQ